MNDDHLLAIRNVKQFLRDFRVEITKEEQIICDT